MNKTAESCQHCAICNPEQQHSKDKDEFHKLPELFGVRFSKFSKDFDLADKGVDKPRGWTLKVNKLNFEITVVGMNLISWERLCMACARVYLVWVARFW